MYKVYSISSQAGSGNTRKPRLIGDIIREMSRSNSFLARDYHKSRAINENNVEKGEKENG